ncbi:hypothetical protein KIN20_013303 [Parelaphostrongylus tenuis]|uniref:Uncharacterized protein n=1 Tax=Parelaphostrongylus tenuis TaxID=148309 RepID=A0AAD5QQW4_PARTN|nr:hypothetical protein KIN20_013303 [Parelaphostrongylus tenuis]
MNSHDLDRFRGLDMNHGFIKSIVKNQIDRDEYHKVMEEKRIESQRSSLKDKRRRSESLIERNLYVPPHLRAKCPGTTATTGVKENFIHRRNPCPAIVSEVEETSLREKVRNRISNRTDAIRDSIFSGTENAHSPTPSRPLFLLNLRKNTGDSVDVAVMNTDSAARLAKELGRKHGFTDDQCRMLRLTLERELEARLSSS